MIRQEFIGRSPGSLPIPVIVDDENASGRQARKKMFEFMARGLVPVGIHTQQRD